MIGSLFVMMGVSYYVSQTATFFELQDRSPASIETFKNLKEQMKQNKTKNIIDQEKELNQSHQNQNSSFDRTPAQNHLSQKSLETQFKI